MEEMKSPKTEYGTTIDEEVQMRKVAPMRIAFRVHLTIFVLVNLILWVLKYTLLSAIVTDETIDAAILKAFICVTIVWLIIVILHFLIAYVWNKTLVEKELAKMRKQRAKQLKKIEELKEKIKSDNN